MEIMKEGLMYHCPECCDVFSVSYERYFSGDGLSMKCECGTQANSFTTPPFTVDSAQLKQVTFPPIDNLFSNMSLHDTVSTIIRKLVIISSSSALYQNHCGLPKRAYFNTPECFYWRQWDFGRALVAKLAEITRDYPYQPETSLLWPLIDRFFQNEFVDLYEFQRENKLTKASFEDICQAVDSQNTLVVEGLTVTPIGTLHHYEVDDPSECMGRRSWHWEAGQGTELHHIVSDEKYRLSQRIYEFVHGALPADEEHGKVATSLKYLHELESW